MMVPGVYLIWLGMAAIVTGVLTLGLDLSLPVQLIDFVFLALIIAFSAKRILGEKPIESSDPLMNRRGARLIGETAPVVQAIEHGSGRIKVGDSEWIAHGPNVGAGERVRIIGTDGAILLVEPIDKLLTDEGAEPAA
jgi:inner membrane protein